MRTRRVSRAGDVSQWDEIEHVCSGHERKMNEKHGW